MKWFALLLIVASININVQAQSITNAYGREVFYVRGNVIKPAKKNFVVLYTYEDSTIYKETNRSPTSALYYIDQHDIKEKARNGNNLYYCEENDDQLTVKSMDGITILVMDDDSIKKNEDSDKVLYQFEKRPPVWALIALIDYFHLDKDTTQGQTMSN